MVVCLLVLSLVLVAFALVSCGFSFSIFFFVRVVVPFLAVLLGDAAAAARREALARRLVVHFGGVVVVVRVERLGERAGALFFFALGLRLVCAASSSSSSMDDTSEWSLRISPTGGGCSSRAERRWNREIKFVAIILFALPVEAISSFRFFCGSFESLIVDGRRLSKTSLIDSKNQNP